MPTQVPASEAPAAETHRARGADATGSKTILLFGDGPFVEEALSVLRPGDIAASFSYARASKPLTPAGTAPVEIDIFDMRAMARALEPFRDFQALIVGSPRPSDNVHTMDGEAAREMRIGRWLASLRKGLLQRHILETSLAAVAKSSPVRADQLFGQRAPLTDAQADAADYLGEVATKLHDHTLIINPADEGDEYVARSGCPAAELEQAGDAYAGRYGYLRAAEDYYGPSANPVLCGKVLAAAAKAQLAMLFVEAAPNSIDLLNDSEGPFGATGQLLYGGLPVHGREAIRIVQRKASH